MKNYLSKEDKNIKQFGNKKRCIKCDKSYDWTLPPVFTMPEYEAIVKLCPICRNNI